MDEECRSCGYSLDVHVTPIPWKADGKIVGFVGGPDPNGGCPADEIEALRRWGLM